MTARSRSIVSGVFVFFGVVFLLAPLLATIPVSFTGRRYLSMPDGNWSLQHYQTLLYNDVWQSGILTSVLIGLLVAALSTFLAVLFATGLWFAQSAWTRILVALALTPMAVPPIISSLTMYFFSVQARVYDSVPGVVIAHTVMALPYAVITTLVSIYQVDRRIELAARNLGASLWQTTVWVILPNIRFGLLSAAFLSFVLSWEEISVTLFVTSVNVITLPRLMWSGLRENIDPVIAAIAVILTAIAALCVFLKREVKNAA